MGVHSHPIGAYKYTASHPIGAYKYTAVDETVLEHLWASVSTPSVYRNILLQLMRLSWSLVEDVTSRLCSAMYVIKRC